MHKGRELRMECLRLAVSMSNIDAVKEARRFYDFVTSDAHEPRSGTPSTCQGSIVGQQQIRDPAVMGGVIDFQR